MRFKTANVTAATIAAAGWTGLALQFYLSTTSGRDATFFLNAFRYFSYFTILTNLFVALIATASLLPERIGRWLRGPQVKAAGATYITMVALVYWLLLRSHWNPQGMQAVADMLLHAAVPGRYVFYWLAFVEKGSLRWRSARAWLAYPLAYFAFVLVRGALVGAYPYPFVDVNQLGYLQVTANAAAFLTGFAALGSTVVATDRAAARLTGRAPSRR
jgi:hypothetical protein